MEHGAVVPCDAITVQLVGRGEEKRNGAGKVTKAGFSEADLEKAQASGGNIPMHDYLRQRVRYFTDGAALGTRAFVNGIFKAKQECFSAKRKDGARTLKRLGRANPLRTGVGEKPKSTASSWPEGLQSIT